MPTSPSFKANVAPSVLAVSPSEVAAGSSVMKDVGIGVLLRVLILWTGRNFRIADGAVGSLDVAGASTGCCCEVHGAALLIMSLNF